MTEKWQLYSQTGVDGPEYGIRIRPGYTVVGFQKEDAEAIVAWQNASIRSAPENSLLERAKIARYDMECLNCFVYKSHEELITEVERLRSEIMRPVETFGTPELVEWIENLHRLVVDIPESERGQIPFDMKWIGQESAMVEYYCDEERAMERARVALEKLRAEPFHCNDCDPCKNCPENGETEKARAALEEIRNAKT